MIKVTVIGKSPLERNEERWFESGDWEGVGKWISAYLLIFPGRYDIKTDY